MWKEIHLSIVSGVLAVCALQFPFDKEDKNDFRLSKDILPNHYDLQLRPNFYGGNESLFEHVGRVRIYLHCIRSTNKLILHASGLEISEERTIFKEIQDGGYNRTIELTWTKDEERDFIIGNLNQSMIGGKRYTLEMDFSAPIEMVRINGTGLYVHSYTTIHNVTEYFLGTNMAPTYARTVFPCFDEPSFRATFDISITRKLPYRSLGNMPIASTVELPDGWIEDTFQRTVNMPTYLIGIFMSQFQNTQVKTDSGILNRVWSTADTLSSMHFFTNYTAKALQALSDYFGIAYPLPKLDHIAHPYFRYNAMENWGIIMYQNQRLEYEENHGEPLVLNMYMYTAAHEIAHMLFGNLVTMKWWTDLWLKEGFAELVAVAILGPRSSPHFSEEFFCISKRRLARNWDSYSVAEPTRYPSAKKREHIFKAYSKYTLYAKGGALNRMFRFILGNETFKIGLKNYLISKSYNAADQWDLINALQEAVNKHGDRDGRFDLNVSSLIGSWTWQPGYPVVHIQSDGTLLHITQARFLMPGGSGNWSTTDDDGNKNREDLKYDVPLLLRHTCKDMVDDVPRERIEWLYHNKGPITTKNPCESSQWLIGNAGSHGYYRVNYDRGLWSTIAKQLHDDHLVFTTPERANLVDDAIALLRYGQVDFDVFIDVVSYIHKERRFLPWRVFLEDMESLIHLTQSVSPKLMEFTRDMVSQAYDAQNEEVLWSPLTDDIESELRRDLIMAACQRGHEPCVKRGREIIGPDANGDKEMNIRGLNNSLACAAWRDLSEPEWENQYNRLVKMLNADGSWEVEHFAIGLACNNDSALRERLFWRVVSNATLIEKIGFFMVDKLLSFPKAVPYVLQTLAVLTNDSNRKSFASQLLSPGKIVQTIIASVGTEEERLLFTKMVNEYGEVLNSTISVYQDMMYNNIAFLQRQRENLLHLKLTDTNGQPRWALVKGGAGKLSSRTMNALMLAVILLFVVLIF